MDGIGAEVGDVRWVQTSVDGTVGPLIHEGDIYFNDPVLQHTPGADAQGIWTETSNRDCWNYVAFMFCCGVYKELTD